MASGNPFGLFQNAPGYIPANVAQDPYWFSNTGFDTFIGQFGIRVLWEKSHSCPCSWQSYPNTRGSPQPSCLTCSGLGWYWDAPVGPFQSMISYAHSPLAADEPGSKFDNRYGQVLSADPVITIGYSNQQIVWQEASEFDRYTELDSFWRYNATLYAGQKTILPYTQGIYVAPTGAVTYYNTATSSVVPVTGYAWVSGSNVVTIPSGYAYGTPYTVEFYSNPQYVAIRRAGGFPHTRPFVSGGIPLPKKFRLALADLWLRQGSHY